MKRLATILGIAFMAVLPVQADNQYPANWDSVVKEARNQTVYWNAWGGSDNINAYIDWVGERVEEQFGIQLVHVKLEDTATAVATVLAEKAAGKLTNGTIDLIWINGENFASMKERELILSPGWAQTLPNWQFVDHETKPTITVDFTVPTEGLESPWGMAKLVFFHDNARSAAADMPGNTQELLNWAKKNPGKFSYPQPPDFIGSSFLKQVLSEQVENRDILQKPVIDSQFEAVTKPLFDYLDQLHPVMWRQARAFPKNYPAMKQMLADGEVDIIFAFNPGEASAAIAAGELPDTVRSFVFPNGTLSNTHFVTIPFNANAVPAALVVANFLISPEAQAHKQDPAIWGDPTVLSMNKLDAEDRDRFEALELGIATLAPDQLGPAIEEPHASWMTKLEEKWKRRYGVAN